jgi:hypothetical protein
MYYSDVIGAKNMRIETQLHYFLKEPSFPCSLVPIPQVLCFLKIFRCLLLQQIPSLLLARSYGNRYTPKSDTECIPIFITQLHIHVQTAYWSPWVDRYNLTFRNSVTNVSDLVPFFVGFRALK